MVRVSIIGKQHQPIIIAGPTCVGKSSVSDRLSSQLDDVVLGEKYKVRAEPRAEDEGRRDSINMSGDKFKQLLEHGKIIYEYTLPDGTRCGVSSSVQDELKRRNVVIITGTADAFMGLKGIYHNAITVLLYTNLIHLENRLRERACSDEERERRMTTLAQEMLEFSRISHEFKYLVLDRQPEEGLLHDQAIDREIGLKVREISEIVSRERMARNGADYKGYHQSYVDEKVGRLFGMTTADINRRLQDGKSLKLDFDEATRKAVLESSSDISTADLERVLPVPVLAYHFDEDYGRHTILLRGLSDPLRTPPEVTKYQEGLTLDLIRGAAGVERDKKLHKASYSRVSAYGLVEVTNGILRDGMLYALTEQFLEENPQVHLSLNFGFVYPGGDEPVRIRSLQPNEVRTYSEELTDVLRRDFPPPAYLQEVKTPDVGTSSLVLQTPPRFSDI